MRDTLGMAVSEQLLDEAIAADADAFCRRVGASAFFAAGCRVAVARAPGRLDLLGGIADYSGGLVLELPLRAAAFVAAQRTEDGPVVPGSAGRRGSGRAPGI